MSLGQVHPAAGSLPWGLITRDREPASGQTRAGFGGTICQGGSSAFGGLGPWFWKGVGATGSRQGEAKEGTFPDVRGRPSSVTLVEFLSLSELGTSTLGSQDSPEKACGVVPRGRAENRGPQGRRG